MNPYETLQVDRHADLEVIRAAYRVLARRHHPDVGGDAAKMAAVNEAWAILEDPLRRARLDREERQARIRAAAEETLRTMAPDGVRGTPVMARDRPTPRAEGATAAAEPATSAWSAPSPARPSVGAARGDGTVLDFGRYVGWSIPELGRHDPDYLLWLERTPAGRGLRSEIRAVFEGQGRGSVATAERRPATARAKRSWFR